MDSPSKKSDSSAEPETRKPDACAPTIPDEERNRFRELYRAGKTTDARRMLGQRLSALDPSDIYALVTLTYNLAITEQLEGAYLESYRLLERVERHLEGIPDTYLKARFYGALGYAFEQLARLERIPAFNNRAREAYARSSYYYENSDRPHLAWHALNNLAHLLIQTGKPKEAAGYLDRAEALLNESPFEDAPARLAEVKDTRALLALKSKNHIQALRLASESSLALMNAHGEGSALRQSLDTLIEAAVVVKRETDSEDLRAAHNTRSRFYTFHAG